VPPVIGADLLSPIVADIEVSVQYQITCKLILPVWYLAHDPATSDAQAMQAIHHWVSMVNTDKSDPRRGPLISSGWEHSELFQQFFRIRAHTVGSCDLERFNLDLGWEG
jgi:hypothetical protein